MQKRLLSVEGNYPLQCNMVNAGRDGGINGFRWWLSVNAGNPTDVGRSTVATEYGNGMSAESGPFPLYVLGENGR